MGLYSHFWSSILDYYLQWGSYCPIHMNLEWPGIPALWLDSKLNPHCRLERQTPLPLGYRPIMKGHMWPFHQFLPTCTSNFVNRYIFSQCCLLYGLVDFSYMTKSNQNQIRIQYAITLRPLRDCSEFLVTRAPTDSRLWNSRLFQDFFRTRNNSF